MGPPLPIGSPRPPKGGFGKPLPDCGGAGRLLPAFDS